MSRITSKGLFVWDLTTDAFNHTQLAANWDLVDAYWTGFDATTKLPKRLNTSATIPVGGTAGDLVMVTASTGGYQPYTLMKYDGSNYRPVAYEIVPTVPVSGLFPGRLVMLSTADGGFNAWDLIRYDGSTWSIIGGLAAVNTGGGALNIQGLSTPKDIYFTSGSRGSVFTDRTSGLKYRIYVDNASLLIEKVT